ncbi:MAG: hypothetical protein ACF8Q5_01630 [Phycisphaerales bacterium JB040]
MDLQVIDLWLPVVVATVACFFASSLMWMVLPHHKADIRPLPDEKAFTRAISPLGLEPGLYMYPNCQEGETMGSEEFKARWQQGPWGTVNIIGARPNFPRNLAVNLFECFVIAGITAYLASMAMNAGANTTDVVRFTFASAFLGFVVGGWSGAAFMGTPLRMVLTSLFDAVVYSALTATAFALLWPAAEASLPAMGG